jgi:hypothetical protein
MVNYEEFFYVLQIVTEWDQNKQDYVCISAVVNNRNPNVSQHFYVRLLTVYGN